MKKLSILFILLLAVTTINAQTKAGDVIFQNTTTYGSEKLTINGAGIREKYFMDMYAAALYVKSRSNDGTGISKANEPVVLRIHIISSLITSEKMEEAIREGFEKSAGKSLAAFQPRIAQFRSAFKDPIKPGDVFEISYNPSEQMTVVTKAGKEKTRVQGLDFKAAVFGIWLSALPADEDLKDGLLGK